MNSRLSLILIALVLTCWHPHAWSSDYTEGVDAINRAAYAVARTNLLRSAERGHVKSQIALGMLAATKTDRPPRFDEALGWFLAAQENGAQGLEERIAKARESMDSASDTETQRIVASYGLAAVQANWGWGPKHPEYTACDAASTPKEAPDRDQSVGPPIWRHGAIGVIERSPSGRLVDVQVVFRVPTNTRWVTEDLFVRGLLSNARSVAAPRCPGYETLVVKAPATRSDRQEMLDEIYASASKGNPEALHFAGMFSSMTSQGGYDSGIPFIQEAAQAGEYESQHFMAKRIGHNSIGRKWLELAAAGDVPLAQIELAELLLISPDSDARFEQIQDLLQRASTSNDQYVLARLAAIRAAAPDDRLRDANAASRFAQQLDLKKWPLPIRMESAALSHAAVGDFKSAVKLQKQAISGAKRIQYDVTRMEERLAAFEAGRPWLGYLAAEYR